MPLPFNFRSRDLPHINTINNFLIEPTPQSEARQKITMLVRSFNHTNAPRVSIWLARDKPWLKEETLEPRRQHHRHTSTRILEEVC